MFSGLIAHTGRVVAIDDAAGGRRLRLDAADAVAEGVAVKDSIAVDGVCLTATAVDGPIVSFDVVPETLTRSTLGGLRPGDAVNLELSLRVGDRVGGHFVYGHVDATVSLRKKAVEGQGHRLYVETPPNLRRFIVEKGYVTLDGVSLTIASVEPDAFTIALIPETSARTSLGRKDAGARYNLEIDPIARYALAAAGDITDAESRVADELAWAYEI